MTRYHVNPETGRPNQCKAKIRCDFAVDGQEPPHFETKEEAKKHGESLMSEKHGGPTKTVSKSSTKTGITNYAKLSNEDLNDEIRHLKDEEKDLYDELATHKSGINDLEIASEIAESVGVKEANEFLKEREYRISGSDDDKDEFYKNISKSTTEAKNKKNAARSAIVRTGLKRKEAEGEARTRQNNVKKTDSSKSNNSNTNDRKKLELNDDYDYEAPNIIAVEGGGYGGNAWVGSKVGDRSYIPTKEVAKNVRQDLKEATAGDYLPKGLKYSVNVDSYSGGSSINIKIYGAGDVRDMYQLDERFYGQQLKPEYRELQERVQNLVNAYNYNDSNGQIDYFNSSFHSRVEIASGYEQSYKEHESERRKFNNTIKELQNGQNKDLSNNKEFLEQEKTYYDSLHNYFANNAYENSISDFIYTNKRMPSETEYDDLEKKSVEKGSERVALTKERNDKYGTRFSRRS